MVAEAEAIISLAGMTIVVWALAIVVWLLTR